MGSGQARRQSLVQICDKKTARVSWIEKDRNGRTLGRVWCGGIDANAEQVRRGMAWVFDRYVKDRSLYPLQDAARFARAARSTSRCCARSASSPASRPACWRRRSPSSAPLGVDARIVVSLAAVQGKPRLRRADGGAAEGTSGLLVQQVTDAAHKDISGNGFAPFDPSRHATRRKHPREPRVAQRHLPRLQLALPHVDEPPDPHPTPFVHTHPHEHDVSPKYSGLCKR